MLQNKYTLPDLIDLALIIPEVGAVNFNILHTILHTIVKELEITDIRPYCHIENPMLAKTELMRAKLKEVKHKREPTPSENVGIIFSDHSIRVSSSDKEQRISKGKDDTSPLSPEPSKELPEKTSPAEQLQPPLEVSDITTQTEGLEPTISEIPPATTKKAESKPEDSMIAETTNQDVKKEQFEIKREPTPKPDKRQHTTEDFWKYKHLESRVEALEETLQSVSDVVDILVNKIMKSGKRKKGESASEELEAIDERILEVEEAMARSAADHDLLMEMDNNLNDILKEFEAIKSLASMLEQMRLDISKKADKGETWAALATKGDLELVNTKVDQLEFETAIEELGEAIGLLGLKFTRKNDEWEERAAEIWRGIDSKMTRDIFEAAKVKIESRLTALMYGLRKLKNVVEELLYPESSGVTRCILCRRPACISGLECLGISDSPKRRLSDKSSEDEDPKKLRETINNAIAKRQKMDAPPYPKMQDTIITIPYSSSSYRSSIDEKQEKEMPQIKLMPINPDKESTNIKKNSQIPKLPEINDVEPSLGTTVKKPMRRSRAKPRIQKAELVFTKKRLERLERSNVEILPPEKYRYTAVLEVELPKKASSRQSSARSSKSIEVTPDPDKTLNAFTPARLMSDALRRDIIVSPTSPKAHEFSMILAPLQFDTESNRSASSRVHEKQEEDTTDSRSISSDESEISKDT